MNCPHCASPRTKEQRKITTVLAPSVIRSPSGRFPCWMKHSRETSWSGALFADGGGCLVCGPRSALVLALIITTFVLVDVAPNNTLTRLVTNVLFGTMFFVALRVVRVRKRVLLATLLLAAIVLVLSLTLSGEDQLLVIPKFIAAVLIALVALAIVFRILRHPSVDVEMIYGALSVYLLIGLFFAFAYAIVGTFTQFFTAAGNNTIQDYLYFSFVTLPTLGFGDLAPKGGLPRTLVVIEAVLGQLHLVTVVALLVSNYTRRSPPPSE